MRLRACFLLGNNDNHELMSKRGKKRLISLMKRRLMHVVYVQSHYICNILTDNDSIVIRFRGESVPLLILRS